MNTTATEQFLQFADQIGVTAAAETHLSNSEGIAPILEVALSVHAGDEKAAFVIPIKTQNKIKRVKLKRKKGMTPKKRRQS